jgi:hypothetical protein
MCSNRRAVVGRADGEYYAFDTILGVREEDKPNRPIKEYEYCVEGNRLLWREGPGSSSHLVLVRTVDPPPGATDPVEIPR